jgi:hypothetical protein
MEIQSRLKILGPSLALISLVRWWFLDQDLPLSEVLNSVVKTLLFGVIVCTVWSMRSNKAVLIISSIGCVLFSIIDAEFQSHGGASQFSIIEKVLLYTLLAGIIVVLCILTDARDRSETNPASPIPPQTG